MIISRANAEALEKTIGQFDAIYDELALLSKKSPSDLLNAFKLKLINTAIGNASKLLGAQYEPIPGFTGFDEDDRPSTSDAVFVVSQFNSELERMRADNLKQIYGSWYYNLENEDPESGSMQTSQPKLLSKK